MITLNWSFFFFFTVYIFSIFLTFNFFSLFIFWMLMEINLIIFLILCCKSYGELNFSKYSSSMFYFLVQSLGSMLMLLGFFYSDWDSFIYIPPLIGHFLVLSIILKTGLWPFHYWFMKFSLDSNFFIFFLILTLQKIPVLIFLFHSSGWMLTLLLLTVNVIFGVFFLLFSKDFIFSLVGSSLYTMLWFYLGYCDSLMNFLVVFLMYSIACAAMSCLKMSLFTFLTEKTCLILCSFIFLLGLPPFSFFFLKINLLVNSVQFLPFSFLGLVWLSTFLIFIGYFKNFFFLQVKELLLYSCYIKNYFPKLILFFFPMMFFI